MAEETAEQRTFRELRYRKVRNRESLETLPNGICITRAVKHEPIDLSGRTPVELRDRTDKRAGSKFLQEWTLIEYVDWLARVVHVLRWDLTTRPAKQRLRLGRQIGISNGNPVRTIEVVFDGRNVHAYPAEDK